MFVVELPKDEYGNLMYIAPPHRGPQVIEVEAQDAHTLCVIAPDPAVFPWRELIPQGWLEVSGPARTLSDVEYVQLLQQHDAPAAYLERARQRTEETV